MEKTNANIQARPFQADQPNDELYSLLPNMAKYTLPCVFKRTERAPIDPYTCFNTFQQLQEYISDGETTAYPGMIVAVTGMYDSAKGVYVLMSDGITLIPTPVASMGAEILWQTEP